MDGQDGIEIAHGKNGPVDVREGKDSDSMHEQGVHQTMGSHSADLPAPHLDRFINFLPTVAFAANLQCSWEALAVSFQAGLLNGGPTSLVWGTLLCWAGNLAVATSIGEMASINPTVGAQYRWCGLYAPTGVMSPAFWALIQGWVTVFGWIAVAAQPAFLVATLVQGLIILNNADYNPKAWHGTLLALAMISIPVICNIFTRKILSGIEIAGGITHTVFWVVWIVVLVTMARRSSPEYVFTTTYNGGAFGGWPSNGVSWCVGLLTAAFPLSAFDGVIHMSDEVKDAPRKVPWSMVLSILINGVMTFITVIILLYCIGNPVEALKSPTGYPVIEILYQATGSKAGATILILMLSWDGLVALFSSMASISRLTWAFARDRGLPFPDFFGRVHPRLRIPLNSLLLVATIVSLLMLLNIASVSAIFAILSLGNIALYLSYLVAISFFVLYKLRGRPLVYGPFKLGTAGYAINAFAICYLVFIVIWLPFPPYLPVTWTNMNYAGPIVGAVIVIAIADWFLWGHTRFSVPTEKSVFAVQ